MTDKNNQRPVATAEVMESGYLNPLPDYYTKEQWQNMTNEQRAGHTRLIVGMPNEWAKTFLNSARNELEVIEHPDAAQAIAFIEEAMTRVDRIIGREREGDE